MIMAYKNRLNRREREIEEIWLTVAMFMGDTDVNMITPWPWI